MKFDRIEHYDHFDTETIFWVDISNMPETIQSKAREIGGIEYNPSCFGMCVIYDWAKREFDLIVDIDPSTSEHYNVHYIDTDGNKHWFTVELDPKFIEGIFAACGEQLKSIMPSEIIISDVEKEGKNDMENFDDLFIDQPAQQEETPFDKGAWAAKKQSERENVYLMIDTFAHEMSIDGGLFSSYLDVQARFDRYSVSNAILVAAQYPEATRLADFDTWKDYGTYVRRGQDAISILEPGKEYQKDDGSTGVSCNVKKVFDISQTHYQQRPMAAMALDDRLLLKALMNNAPCRFAISNELTEGVNVAYHAKESVIYVRQGLDAPTIFRGLAQELARAHMDKRGCKCLNPDFTAYSVSYMLCKRNGVSVEGFSFDRMPEDFGLLDAKAIRAEAGTIRDVAGEISADMNRLFAAQEKAQKDRDNRAR